MSNRYDDHSPFTVQEEDDFWADVLDTLTYACVYERWLLWEYACKVAPCPPRATAMYYGDIMRPVHDWRDKQDLWIEEHRREKKYLKKFIAEFLTAMEREGTWETV